MARTKRRKLRKLHKATGFGSSKLPRRPKRPELPEPIDATAEEVARVVLGAGGPPGWRDRPSA